MQSWNRYGWSRTQSPVVRIASMHHVKHVVVALTRFDTTAVGKFLQSAPMIFDAPS